MWGRHIYIGIVVFPGTHSAGRLITIPSDRHDEIESPRMNLIYNYMVGRYRYTTRAPIIIIFSTQLYVYTHNPASQYI